MIIGITGGVGTGKSSVLEILENEYGARVIIADEVAKFLEDPGEKCYAPIVEEFGEEILDMSQEGHPIDRKKLAEIVFADPDRLEDLDYIVHPVVKTEIMCEISGCYHTNIDALIVVESALLIEIGFLDIVDDFWIVTADKEVRYDRLEKNRGYSREKCDAIMKSQMDFEEFYDEADLIIDNSGSFEETKKQIKQRMDEILAE